MVTPNSIGSYTIEKRLGRGSMGEVFRATRFGSDEHVAVKILRGDVADEPELLGRFLRERSLLLSLDDPSLVRVRDLVVEGGSAAIVMDLMEGGDLRNYMNQHGKIDAITAATFMVSIFGALSIVHQAGIIHRDVKPENLLFDDAQGIHLADFGIAKFLDRPQITQTIGIFGTPAYMAPETGLHDRVTVACDVYSAGVVLFEMLAGQTPFVANSPLAMMRLHAEEEVVYPKTFPRAMREFLGKVLAKNPEDRPTALQAKNELAELLAAKRLGVRSRRASPPAKSAQGTSSVVPQLAVAPVAETIMSNRRSQGSVQKKRVAVTASAGEPVATPEKPRRRFSLWWFTAPVLLIAIIVLVAVATSSSGPDIKPSDPVDLSALLSLKSVVVHWKAPVENSSTVDKYLVRATEGKKHFTVIVKASQKQEYGYAFPPLSLGERFSFNVATENAQGKILSSHKSIGGLLAFKPSPPEISAVSSGNEIVVTWHVANDNGERVTRFTLTDNHNSKLEFGGSVSRYVLRNPIRGLVYRFQVTATNKLGHSNSKLTHPITIAATSSTKAKPVATTTTTHAPSKQKASRPDLGPAFDLRAVANGQADGVTFSWVNPRDGDGYVLVSISASITSTGGTSYLEAPYLSPANSSVEASISTSGPCVFEVTESIRHSSTKAITTYTNQIQRTITISSSNRLLVSP